MQQTTPSANSCLFVMYEKIHFQLKNKTKSTKWTRTAVSIKNW